MKKLIYLFIATTAMACKSTTPEEKVKQTVKLYLDSTLKDPKSYEPMQFSQMDTVFDTWLESSTAGKEFGKQMAVVSRTHDKFRDKAEAETMKDNSDVLLQSYWQNKADSVDIVYMKMKLHADSMNLTYKGPKLLFLVNHKFRAKNGFGALDINNMEFKIDTTLTKVLDAKTVQ